MVDDSGRSVKCALWGDEASNFDMMNVGSVVAFKGASLSDYGGRSLSCNQQTDIAWGLRKMALSFFKADFCIENMDSNCSSEFSLYFHSIYSFRILNSSGDIARIKETTNVRNNYTTGGQVPAVRVPSQHTAKVVALVAEEELTSGNS